MLTNPALADIAPPGRPPGADILPGDETTRVRMVAETVTLDILDDPAANTLGQAETHAVFTMRNIGTADEQMEVRFPLSYWDYSSGDKRDTYPEIGDFKAFENGKSVQFRRAEFSDADWHAGFADLLWTRFYYILQWEERSAAGPVLIQLLEEILASLTLDSDNKYAIRIADEIYYSSDYIDRTDNGEYIFQALTDVPTFPTWTPTPTLTPTHN